MKNTPLTIPGYEILEKIGEGGMGTVYKAHQISLNRFVAIKRLPEALASRPDYIEHLQAEARLEATLRHSNLVQVYEAGQSNGIYYFIMEYIAGYTVATLLDNKGRLKAEDCLTIAESVAVALRHAWDKAQIVHGDIKPGNIMIDADGTIKIGDFLPLGRPDEPGTTQIIETYILGTPNYMSPEQGLGERDLDARSDIYGLGALLYHLVTGVLPFAELPADHSMEDTLKVQLTDILDLVPGAPRNLVWLIDKMLVRDRAQRYESWDVFLEDLDRVRGGGKPQLPWPEEGTTAMLRAPARKVAGLAAATTDKTLVKVQKKKLRLKTKEEDGEQEKQLLLNVESPLAKAMASVGLVVFLVVTGLIFFGLLGWSPEEMVWPPPVEEREPEVVEVVEPEPAFEPEPVVEEPIEEATEEEVEESVAAPDEEEEFFTVEEVPEEQAPEVKAPDMEWTQERAKAFQAYTLQMRKVRREMERKAFHTAGRLLDEWQAANPDHLYRGEFEQQRNWIALPEKLMDNLVAKGVKLAGQNFDEVSGKGQVVSVKKEFLTLSSVLGASRASVDIPMGNISDDAFLELLEVVDPGQEMINSATYYLGVGNLSEARSAINSATDEGLDTEELQAWLSSQEHDEANYEAYMALSACMKELRRGNADLAERLLREAENEHRDTDVFQGGGQVQIDKIKQALEAAQGKSSS